MNKSPLAIVWAAVFFGLSAVGCDSSVSVARPDVVAIDDLAEDETNVIDCQPEEPDTAVDILSFTPCLAHRTETECEKSNEPNCEWFEMKKACTDQVVGFCEKQREYIQGPLILQFIRLVNDTTCYTVVQEPHSGAWTACTYPFVWEGQCHQRRFMRNPWFDVCEDYGQHYPYLN